MNRYCAREGLVTLTSFRLGSGGCRLVRTAREGLVTGQPGVW